MRLAGTAGPVSHAFVISSSASAAAPLLSSLYAAGVTAERWPATRGSPALNESHRSLLSRGIEPYLRFRRCPLPPCPVRGWGTVGNYVSHLTLFEHIAQRWTHQDDATPVLVLQDDVVLHPDWAARTKRALARAGDAWERLLLVWFGASRRCDQHHGLCVVGPPAGPTLPADGAECCGVRYYHGLQASLVRPRALRACVLPGLKHLPIKAIDAAIVDLGCPRAFALHNRSLLGEHARGSEKGKIDAAAWRLNQRAGFGL